MRKMLLLGLLAVVSLASSTTALAGRFPSEVDSLDQAMQICKSEPAKHVLVFYTNYRS
jgi:hypothetical protein